MKRRVFAVVAILLCAASAQAGMTPEQMRARLKEIDAELNVIGQGPFVHTVESIQADMRDLDRRKFENGLDLVRVNACREVVLVHAKVDELKNRVDKEQLQLTLEALTKERIATLGAIQKTVSEKTDSASRTELNAREAELAKLDAAIETAKNQLSESDSGSRFSDVLTDQEIELAGINAVRKALDQRSEELNRRYEQVADIDARLLKLKIEREQLRTELDERGLPYE